ncbi:type II secretion system F family protein [Candidatus Woesearchaeota archaeon]|nr:type II secretion system F family protein [Candidatus Woesearchaeota archaeon]
MNLKIIFLEEFGRAFIPKKFRPHLRQYLLKAGIVEVPYRIIGGMFYLSILATLIIYLLKVYPLFEESGLVKVFFYTLGTWVALPLGFASALALIFYFYLDMKIFNRTKRMEEVLPDFLRFVAENLKGGMPFERALWSAIRPEFGVLANEVRLAAKKVMTGEDVDEALREFTSKYDSPTLRRSFDLIIEGMKGGGKTAYLIDRVVEDLEETRELKQEMNATNLSYVIFVSIIVLAVAPALFTLSYQFLMILISIGGRLEGVQTQGVMDFAMNFGNVALDPDSFKTFSRQALGVLSVFSAMIISQISRGNIKGGIKYIPVFLAITQVIYIGLMWVADKVFGGLMT